MGDREGDQGAPGTARRSGNRRVAAGIAYILVSGACFGCMPILARFAYRSGVNVPTLLMLRFGVAAACLWAVMAWKGQPAPRGRGLVLLGAMGAVVYAGQAGLLFSALTLASAGLVSLLLYTFPAMVAVLARMVFRHRLTRLQVAAVVIALGGSALTIGRAADGRPLGIALALASALAYSIYILAGSRIPAAISPTASSAVIVTAAAVVCAGATAVRGLRLPGDAAGWAGVLGVAVVGTVVAILCFFEGLERVGPVRASVYSTVEPLVTVSLGAVLMGEPFTLARAAGGALIVAAVVLLAREELEAAPAPRMPGPRPHAPAVPPPTGEG